MQANQRERTNEKIELFVVDGLLKLFVSKPGVVCCSQDLKNLSLRHVRLTRTLQRPTIYEVECDTVGELLPVLVWRVWFAELAQMETLRDAFRLLIRFGKAQHKITRSINLNPSTLPQQCIGELNIEIADLNSGRWFSEGGKGSRLASLLIRARYAALALTRD